jgi:hypothetical protein
MRQTRSLSWKKQTPIEESGSGGEGVATRNLAGTRLVAGDDAAFGGDDPRCGGDPARHNLGRSLGAG